MSPSYRMGLLTGASLVTLAILAAAWLPSDRPSGHRPQRTADAGAARPVTDTMMVRSILDASRGTSLLLCEMAAVQVRGNVWWRNREPVDDRVQEVLSRIGQDMTDPAVVPILSASLADPDPCVARNGARLLGRTAQPEAVRALLTALQDSSARVREMAALGLGVAEPAEALEPLTRALAGDPETQVRIMSAWALGQLEDPRAVQSLAQTLSRGPDGLRAASATALGEIENREAVGPLIAALGDDDPEVRRNAAWALGQIEDRRATDGLSRVLLGDSDPAVRRAAARALGEIQS